MTKPSDHMRFNLVLQLEVVDTGTQDRETLAYQTTLNSATYATVEQVDEALRRIWLIGELQAGEREHFMEDARRFLEVADEEVVCE